MEKLKYVFAAIAIQGIMFNTLYWPGSDWLVFLGLTGLTVYCVTKIFKK